MLSVALSRLAIGRRGGGAGQPAAAAAAAAGMGPGGACWRGGGVPGGEGRGLVASRGQPAPGASPVRCFVGPFSGAVDSLSATTGPGPAVSAKAAGLAERGGHRP